MSTSQMSFDDSRARNELGYAPRPAVQAMEESAALVYGERQGGRAPIGPNPLVRRPTATTTLPVGPKNRSL